SQKAKKKAAKEAKRAEKEEKKKKKREEEEGMKNGLMIDDNKVEEPANGASGESIDEKTDTVEAATHGTVVGEVKDAADGLKKDTVDKMEVDTKKDTVAADDTIVNGKKDMEPDVKKDVVDEREAGGKEVKEPKWEPMDEFDDKEESMKITIVNKEPVEVDTPEKKFHPRIESPQIQQNVTIPLTTKDNRSQLLFQKLHKKK
ncbi:hypothetical protein PFISCL1PPCAC_2206, partial [Pristionchus fissidentatus]